MSFKQTDPSIGASPGTLIIPKQAPPPKIHGFHYGSQGVGDKSLMQQIGERVGFHRLLLEDVVNVRQGPKTEVYDD